MKKFTGKRIWQKIIIAFLTFILLFQFMIPIRSEAFDLFDGTDWKELGTNMAIGMAQIVAAGGDLVMGMFNQFMLGTKGFGTAMVTSEALESTASDGKHSWFYPEGVTASEPSGLDGVEVGKDSSGDNIVVYVEGETLDEEAWLAGSSTWEIPNLIYCPENIFGNNIAMLDVNFLNPNEYEAAVYEGRGAETAGSTGKEDAKNVSVASRLKSTIAGWYKAFRNIAVVSLLSILVYLGIRILISSTAEDKAKYKEIIKDWLIALLLVFAMHFIMSFTIMIVNQVNSLFVNINNNVYVSYGGTLFKSNFTGVLRFLAQSKEPFDAWAYTIIYLILVAYTVKFTVQYMKRVLYIAFYTMIAPLVAITYPLDKLGDGKSQAFNKWIKEYIMTMSLQPIHLIIYSAIISSSLSLSIQSPIFAIVAIGFLIPAEQFIKSLFGVESKADGGFGAVATTAVAMNALNKLRNPVKLPQLHSGNGGSGNSGKSGGRDDKDEEQAKVRQTENKELSSFNRDSNGASGNAETGANSNGTGIPARQGVGIGSGNAGENRGVDENGVDLRQLPLEDREKLNSGALSGATEDGTSGNAANGGENNDGTSGSRVAKLFRDTYNNSDLGKKAKKRKIEKAIGTAAKQKAAEDKAKEKEKKAQEKEKKKLEEAEAKKRLKNIRANKFNNNHPKLSGAANKVKDSKAVKFTRSLGGAAKADMKDRADARKAKRAANAPKRAIKKAINKKYRGKAFKTIGAPILKKAIGGAGFVAKHGLRAAGGVIGAGTGLAIGIASGKGISGATQGLVAGAAGGIGLGSTVYNVAAGTATTIGQGAADVATGLVDYGKSIYDLHKEKQTEYIETTQGSDEADKYARNHLSKAEKKRYEQMINDYSIATGENLLETSGKSKSQLYKDIYDYESHGVTDKSKIIKGLQIEHSKDQKYEEIRRKTGLEGNGDKHDNVVDVMQLTNSFGKDYILDDKKNAQFQKKLSLEVNREQDREKINHLFYAANGYTYPGSTTAVASGNGTGRSSRTTGGNKASGAKKNTNAGRKKGTKNNKK